MKNIIIQDYLILYLLLALEVVSSIEKITMEKNENGINKPGLPPICWYKQVETCYMVKGTEYCIPKTEKHCASIDK